MFLQVGIARGRHVALVHDDREIAGIPRFIAIARHGFGEGAGQGGAGSAEVGEGAAQAVLALVGKEGRFFQTVLAEELAEAVLVEVALAVLEGRIRGNICDDRLIGHKELQVFRTGIEHRAVNDPVQHLLVETEAAGIIDGEGIARLGGNPLQVVVEVLAELLARDHHVADLHQILRAEAGPAGKGISHARADVTDTPDGKARHQQAHQHFGNPALCGVAERLKHSFQTLRKRKGPVQNRAQIMSL